MLLEKPVYDEDRFSRNCEVIESGQANLNADVAWVDVDLALKKFFRGISQQNAEDFGKSFDKLADQENRDKEFASIIKNLSRSRDYASEQRRKH